jgi:hypothetical protein
MTLSKPQSAAGAHSGWFCPTPAWLVLGSLAMTGLLFLSERYRWFWFNEQKGWTVLIAVAEVGVVMLAMPFWFVIALLFRRRFQFSIRSLLLLVVALLSPGLFHLRAEPTKRQGHAAGSASRPTVSSSCCWSWSACFGCRSGWGLGGTRATRC